MNDEPEQQPPWVPEVRTDCPVEVPQQAWIEASMAWFAREFGREPVMRATVVPSSELRSTAVTPTPRQIEGLVSGLCELMEVDRAELTLELFDRAGEDPAAARKERRTVGHYYVENGRPVIGLDVTEASDVCYLTAVIAHELCHVRLLGEERITADRKDHERLTDLLTVYFGLGVFTANAALRFGETKRGFSVQPLGYLDERTLNATRNDGYSRLGYLTEREFGYAMACYAWLRRDTEPDWARSLDPGLRVLLRQGLAYLSRNAAPGEFPTPRSGSVRLSVRVVPKADPVWLGGLCLMFTGTEWPPNAPKHRPR
ncbi:hypothetical protein E1293_24900 [Actinomadura darangshiensis]|uniref:Uncharacterized protein n=1 Tax=Actinomadura darangshiensis TaxID=705336 RepID=A0A4R5B0Q0_9ACTN|nr:hypothetical protein [Actinomadura darangshiensis]TDD78020.1 hypothetical protein E1293_24900 [Actinomadura darangshiensis]